MAQGPRAEEVMGEDSILRAVRGGKVYASLPERARQLISRGAFHKKVLETSARARLVYHDERYPALREASEEGEYYAEVKRQSLARQSLFPYHLHRFRVTPFQYYRDMLKDLLKRDKPFSTLPNFTAADMVAVLGIGRDEFVPLVQACKAKRLLWKVNRESAIRDQLPGEPVDLMVEPWWVLRPASSPSVSSQQEDLLEEEAKLLASISSRGSATIDSLPSSHQRAWRSLYRRGLVAVDVPIAEDDCIAVPPLEGFVSNKDGAGEDGDPVETLLYGMFFAASARTTIGELAAVLGAPTVEVREAASVACRLGFARRTTQERRASVSSAMASARGGVDLAATPTASGSDILADHPLASPPLEDTASSAGPKGIAFVVDTEVTATLMMGSLLKDQRHAVTLFEAGKLSGRLAVRELLDELSRVPSVGEGEIQFLIDQIQSLRLVLDLVCAAEAEGGCQADGQPPEIDILRYEVLADLPPSTLNRMLSQHYFLVAFMARLPMPLLKCPISREGPVVHGFPSEAAAMPWLRLLLWEQVQSGLTSLALPKGWQLRRLPSIFGHDDRLLVEFWPEDGGRSQDESVVVHASSALGVLNHALLRSAVLVQRIAKESVEGDTGELVTKEVALPLRDGDEGLGGHEDVRSVSERYGLSQCAGYLTMLRTGPGTSDWKVKGVQFGIPLHSLELCGEVCRRCEGAAALSWNSLSGFRDTMLRLRGDLEEIWTRYGNGGHSQREGEGEATSYLPSAPVAFDGTSLRPWSDAEEDWTVELAAETRGAPAAPAKEEEAQPPPLIVL